MSISSKNRDQDQKKLPGHSTFVLSDIAAEHLCSSVVRSIELLITWTKIVLPLVLTLMLVTCSPKKPFSRDQSSSIPPKQHRSTNATTDSDSESCIYDGGAPKFSNDATEFW